MFLNKFKPKHFKLNEPTPVVYDEVCFTVTKVHRLIQTTRTKTIISYEPYSKKSIAYLITVNEELTPLSIPNYVRDQLEIFYNIEDLHKYMLLINKELIMENYINTITIQELKKIITELSTTQENYKPFYFYYKGFPFKIVAGTKYKHIFNLTTDKAMLLNRTNIRMTVKTILDVLDNFILSNHNKDIDFSQLKEEKKMSKNSDLLIKELENIIATKQQSKKTDNNEVFNTVLETLTEYNHTLQLMYEIMVSIYIKPLEDRLAKVDRNNNKEELNDLCGAVDEAISEYLKKMETKQETKNNEIN